MNKMFRACDWSGAWAERAENLVSGSGAESGCHNSRLERWAENRPLTLRSRSAHMLCCHVSIISMALWILWILTF